MSESKQRIQYRVDQLKVGDLIYFEMLPGGEAYEGVVLHVLDIGYSGDFAYLRCAGRGQDSTVYWNNPSRVHIVVPLNSSVEVVRQ